MALPTLQSDSRPQCSSKFSVTLNVPLAAHCFVAGFAAFRIKQNPSSPASRLSTASCIVLLQASFQVGRPTNVSSDIILAAASQNINEKGHLAAHFYDCLCDLRCAWERDPAGGTYVLFCWQKPPIPLTSAAHC